MAAAKTKSFSWWKTLLPLIIIAVMLCIPAPGDMPPRAWHYFAIFAGMIAGMILEPIPATAVSFIAVVVCIAAGDYLLFTPQELADPAFKAGKEAMKWGLAGFSNSTVWLVFGAFIFALGYEVTGLGKRIALLLVKWMGRYTLTLGYAIVLSDVLLAPFTPSNTARTGGIIFPVIKNLPPLFKSLPNDPSSRRIGGYLMWMMVLSTSISSSMFVTGAAPNLLGLEFINKIAHIQISWAQWFLAFLPVGIILIIVAPWLAYILYKPQITKSEEVSGWAGGALKEMGRLTAREIVLICLVAMSLLLWIFGKNLGLNINAASLYFGGGELVSNNIHLDTTLVALIAVSLMLVLRVVPWKEVVNYSSAWNTLVNLATLVVMAQGLKKSGFIDWFAAAMDAHLKGLSPSVTIIALVLVFYFSHYLFASLTAHTATLMPMILTLAAGVPGLPMEELCLLLVLSIGLMGCLTPYATGPDVIIYGCGYMQSKDYWRLGFIFGVIFIAALLLIGWPLIALGA